MKTWTSNTGTTMLDRADFEKTVVNYDEYLKELWSACLAYLLTQGVDIEEERKNWRSYDFDMTALRGFGPIVIREYLNDERAPRMLVKKHEIPRDEVMK